MAPAGLAAAQQLETITKLADILPVPESDVEQLLAEGRLARLMDLDTSMVYSVGKRLSLLFCGQYKGALEAFRTSK